MEDDDTGDDECTWYGITCDANGIVTSINLEQNDVGGEIPYEIALLDNLGKYQFVIYFCLSMKAHHFSCRLQTTQRAWSSIQTLSVAFLPQYSTWSTCKCLILIRTLLKSYLLTLLFH